MVRAGQPEQAALIYKEVTSGLDKMVRATREKDGDHPEEVSGGAEVVRRA